MKEGLTGGQGRAGLHVTGFLLQGAGRIPWAGHVAARVMTLAQRTPLFVQFKGVRTQHSTLVGGTGAGSCR
ncbi:hypothetical protein E2C01_093349 [Portunus trituberculatus]|uniref:Uncharacterized protein n=1 Tax=Portunus trituberculatus TaxID=210409 RepID=A0A5B7JIR3_PORTR|nr:hypothetical protein [Portunus trituberculatus]